jgi:transposase-like protein
MKNAAILPKTLQEAITHFADPERCFGFAVSLRWPDGKVTCPRCGSDQHSFVSTRHIWFCKGCKKQFTMKVGTIFEDSPLGMDKWMTGLWLLVNCENGISSCEVARDLGITQKSAWFMMHRLRLAMQSGSFQKMRGEIELDETFVGGKARNMHISKRRAKVTGTGHKDKTPVLGFLQRDGEVRTRVISSTKRKTLFPEIEKHIEEGSAVYTDALHSYEGLARKYGHQVIDHAIAYVNGRVHTNGLENFWSLLKRTIRGTYVSVEPFHLDRYLDEQVFRYNNRLEKNDGQRFAEVMSRISGRRLTFDQLTGKQDDPRQIN